MVRAGRVYLLTRWLVALRIGLTRTSLGDREEKRKAGYKEEEREGEKEIMNGRKGGGRKRRIGREGKKGRILVRFSPTGRRSQRSVPHATSSRGGGVPETQVLVSERAHEWRAVPAPEGRRPETTPVHTPKSERPGARAASSSLLLSVPRGAGSLLRGLLSAASHKAEKEREKGEEKGKEKEEEEEKEEKNEGLFKR